MNIEINTCKECKSDYFTKKSQRENLCPNCAHYLYGQKECKHEMKRGRCFKCHWDGTISERISALIDRNKKKLRKVKVNIIIALFTFIIGAFFTIIGTQIADAAIFSLAKYSFGANTWLLFGFFGIFVAIVFFIKTMQYKKRLKKEIPYLN
ncbi:MAG: hypothetical protein AB8B65_10730 [Kordia sp.]|uniref:hypothetical protein n=1 Tax=Kordia sp. TaxID=1965332 RepID=UPI00385A19AC